MPYRLWSNSIFRIFISTYFQSHIHTYAATHDFCFLLEVFEGLVIPGQSELLKSTSGLITPFGSARSKAYPLKSLTSRGPCYILRSSPTNLELVLFYQVPPKILSLGNLSFLRSSSTYFVKQLVLN